jgi:holo-[acyl-carrier protein] synthase
MAGGGGRPSDTSPARDGDPTAAGSVADRQPGPGVGADPALGAGVAARMGPDPGAHLALVAPPEGTTELGIDIIKVARIADTLERFGDRFSNRVLTPREQRYVRGRPETFAGRWAAKEAVSKVLGLGVRGIGWRDIEVERLPTGQPAVRLHGRAAARADQLGMTRIALSISHESDYAVAIAFGVRAAGGRYVFPLDIEERLDERERRVLARMDRLRTLAEGARPDPAGRHAVTEGPRPGTERQRAAPGTAGRRERGHA